MHNELRVLNCSGCKRAQSCCTSADIFPVPVLPEEVDRFGSDKVKRYKGKSKHEVFYAKAVKGGLCPNFDSDERACRLSDRDRPAFCKAYPILHDGKSWFLDAGCPSVGHDLIFKAVFGGEQRRFFRRAFKVLAYRKRGKRMAALIDRIRSGWQFPIQFDMPEEWERKGKRRK